MPLDRITIFCFAASYAVTLGLELLQLLRPARLVRIATYGFAVAGITAHTVYLAYHGQPLRGGPSSLLFLSWVVALFYIIGSLHHRRQAWGIFVLPVALGLVLLAWLTDVADTPELKAVSEISPVWIWLHFGLLVLGAIGLCVAFVASVMYLVQASRLRRKVPPSKGLKLMSLERLETMNRRALGLAFPLFTGGLLIGIGLLFSTKELSWGDPKVLTTVLLWLVFLLLFYLRYALHVRGRRVALWTIAAFAFLVLAFVVNYVLESGHRFGVGS